MSESWSRSVELHPGGSFLAIARFDAVLASPPSRAAILPSSFFCALGLPVATRPRRPHALLNPLLRRAGNAVPAQTAGATGAAQKHWTPERPVCARQSGSVVVVVAAPVPAIVVLVPIVVVVGSEIVVVVVAVIAATSPLTITRSWSAGVVSNHVSSSLPSPVTSPTASREMNPHASPDQRGAASPTG